MTKLPKSYVAQSTVKTSNRKVDDGLSVSHQADPVEVIIEQNLSEPLEYQRVDPNSAWSDFMKLAS